MSQSRYTLKQCQQLVDSVFVARRSELLATDFVNIAAWLICDPGVAVDIQVVLQRWLLAECEPGQLHHKQRITQTDLADNATRAFLALAIPVNGVDMNRIAGWGSSQINGVTQLADLLSVDSSTLYRIQRQARERLAHTLHVIMETGANWYAHFVDALFAICAARQTQSHAEWHFHQAALCEVATNGLAMAWHLAYANDWDSLIVRLHRRAYEVALDPRTTIAPTALAQLEWFATNAPTLKHASRLQRILANQHDVRSDKHSQLAALETALRLAVQSTDEHSIANAYLDLARFYSGRDADKAEGLFRICIELFESIEDLQSSSEDFCYALIQYALFQTQKLNGAAIGLMRRAERLPLPALSQARANLWLEWGTIEWRVGNYAGAVKRYADAAAIYEGLNDKVNLRTAHFNIGLCHLSMQRYDSALPALNAAIDGDAKAAMSNAVQANRLLTRADCYRQLDKFDLAFTELARAIALLRESDEPRTAATVFDLVARTHLRCFKLTGLIEHQLDCASAAAALYALADRHPYVQILASKLRVDLAAPDVDDRNQARFVMTNPEHAANFSELSELDRLREQTIAAESPNERLNARLGISRIYLELSIKERQAALEYAEQHNLLASTTEAVLAMADRHERTLDSRDRLIARWQEHSGLDISTIQAMLTHFDRDDRLTKKAYSALTGVSAATASRVLARLLAAGLLTQHGAGATSHYRRTSA